MRMWHNQNVEHKGKVYRKITVNINDGRNNRAKCKIGKEWFSCERLDETNWTTNQDIVEIQRTAELASELPERLFKR